MDKPVRLKELAEKVDYVSRDERAWSYTVFTVGISKGDTLDAAFRQEKLHLTTAGWNIVTVKTV